MKQLNEKLYVNEDNIQGAQKIGDIYILTTTNGNNIIISESLFNEIKEYEGGGGGGSAGPKMLISDTDATLVDDEYILPLSEISSTPEVNDYIEYVENDVIKSLYKVISVDDTNATLEKLGNVGNGVALNLQFNENEPSDTTKLWLRTNIEPETISIDKETKMIINNEVVSSVNLSQHIVVQSYAASTSVKIGNYIFLAGVYGASSPINIASNGSKSIIKLDLETGNLSFFIGPHDYTNYYILGKKDEYHFYYTRLASQVWTLYYVDIRDGSITTVPTTKFNPTAYWLQKEGDYIYWFKNNSGDDSMVLQRYNLITEEVESFTVNLNNGKTVASTNYFRHIVNNKLYIPDTLLLSSTQSGSYTTYYEYVTRIYIYDIATGEVSTIGQDYFIDRSVTQGDITYKASSAAEACCYAVIDNDVKVYGGSSQYYYYSYSGNPQYGWGTEYKINAAIPVLDEDTKELYLVGGTTYANDIWGYNVTFTNLIRYSKYSYTFTLEEGKLLLTGYLGQGNEVPIINTDTTTVMQEIDFAYLGDSNNQAERIEMYQHKGNAWYGINTSNWNEILDASISVENTVLNMNTEETNTQAYTYTISSVAHNNTPIYTIVADNYNEEVCSATVDASNQTISITTTDNIGITNVELAIVDNYGNRFIEIIQVSSIGFTYTSSIIDISSATSLTETVECKVGDLVVASVIARANGAETVSEGWTLLGRSQIGGGNSQTLAFYYKIAESITESITVNQSSANRIYISMVAITGKTTATIGSFTIDSTAAQKDITLPNNICIVSVSSDLWTTDSPYSLWQYSGTSAYTSILLPNTIQGRLGTFIDYGQGGSRTIICPTTPNTLITGYVIIE